MADIKQPDAVEVTNPPDSSDASSHVKEKGYGSSPMQLDELPPGYYRSKNFIGSVIGVCLMAISLYLGFVLPANTLAVINEDLGPDPNYVLIATAFTLVAGVGLLLVGRLGDILGRRYFLIGGQTLGLIGAIVCGTATKIPTVIAGTVLTGFAGAVQLTFTFVIAELVPNKARPAVNSGLFVSTFPFAAFGPIIAQDFVAHTARQWRWNYYLNIITCGLSALLFLFFYFPPGYKQIHRNTNRWEQVKKLDYIGLVLYSGGLVLVLLGLSWGGSSYPWHSAHVIATLVVGFAALIAFVLYEVFMPLEQPLLPMRLLKSRNYVAVVASASVGTIIYFSMNVLWPEMIAALYTTDTVEAGWLACTTGIAVVVGEILAGLVMKPLGHHRYQLIACTVGMTAFLGALAAANQHRRSLAIACTILGGLSVGYQELICIIMAALICEPKDIGLASGFLGSWKQVSGSIATTIYVTILSNRVKHTLPENVTPAALNAGLPSSDLTQLFTAIGEGTPAALEAVPDITPGIIAAVADALKTAYSQAFRTVFLTSIAFGGLAVIAACFSKDIDERLNNNEVAKRLRGGPGGESDELIKSKDVAAAASEKGSA